MSKPQPGDTVRYSKGGRKQAFLGELVRIDDTNAAVRVTDPLDSAQVPGHVVVTDPKNITA